MQNTKKRTIADEVDRIVAEMSTLSVDSKEYELAAKNLYQVCQARGVKATQLITPDAVIGALVNILGIVLILNYEQAHVVTSKALGFIGKLRV